MNDRIQLTPEELLMGRMAALIESSYGPSEDYLERYMRVTDMSLDQDTVKNLNNLTPEQHRKVRNIIRWQRIGCIVVKISETLDVSLKEALDMFYWSETCRRFLNDTRARYNLYPSPLPTNHKIPKNRPRYPEKGGDCGRFSYESVLGLGEEVARAETVAN